LLLLVRAPVLLEMLWRRRLRRTSLLRAMHDLLQLTRADA